MANDSAPEAGRVPRLELIQAGRAIAAIAVVGHHIHGKLAASHYFGSNVFQFLDWGKTGVDFFFVLSGFIIGAAVARAPLVSDFFARRFVRIYPPFWVAFIFTWAIASYFSSSLHSSPTTDPWSLLAGFMLLPQAGDAPVIGVAWTLHHELLFYALAGIWLFARRLGYVLSAIILIGVVASPTSFPLRFLCSPLHWEFLFGVLVAITYKRVPIRIAKIMWAVATLVLISMAAAYCNGFIHDDNQRTVTFGLGYGLLVCALARIETEPGFVLRWPCGWLSRLGDSSYTLYLWHISLVTPALKVGHHFNPLAGPGYIFVLGVVTLVTTVLAGHWIYQAVESPVTILVADVLGLKRDNSAATRGVPRVPGS